MIQIESSYKRAVCRIATQTWNLIADKNEGIQSQYISTENVCRNVCSNNNKSLGKRHMHIEIGIFLDGIILGLSKTKSRTRMKLDFS